MLLNPSTAVDDEVLDGLAQHQQVTVVVGALGNWRRARVWADRARANPHWEFVQLRGVANYIPDWT